MNLQTQSHYPKVDEASLRHRRMSGEDEPEEWMSQSRYLNFCVISTELPSTLTEAGVWRRLVQFWILVFAHDVCIPIISASSSNLWSETGPWAGSPKNSAASYWHSLPLNLRSFLCTTKFKSNQNLSYATGFQLGLILLCLFSLILFLVFTTP